MIVGVPRESFPGERRVALVPAVVPNLAKAGLEVVVEAGAGVEAGYPDAEYVNKGAKVLASRGDVFSTADIIVQVLSYGSNDQTGRADLAAAAPRPGADRISAAARRRSHSAGNCRNRRDLVLRRVDAAHHPRAEHGRALLDGDHLRLQGRAGRRRQAAAHLPHADHCGRNDHAFARAGDRRGRRGIAGHCHRAPTGRGRFRLRSCGPR